MVWTRPSFQISLNHRLIRTMFSSTDMKHLPYRGCQRLYPSVKKWYVSHGLVALAHVAVYTGYEGGAMSFWMKRLFPALVGLLILFQLVRPSTVNPPIDSKQGIAAHLKVEPAVQSI